VRYLNFSVGYLKLAVRYLKLAVRYLKFSVDFLKLAVRYLKFSVDFLKLSVRFLNFSVGFLKLAVRFLKLAVGFLKVAVPSLPRDCIAWLNEGVRIMPERKVSWTLSLLFVREEYHTMQSRGAWVIPDLNTHSNRLSPTWFYFRFPLQIFSLISSPQFALYQYFT